MNLSSFVCVLSICSLLEKRFLIFEMILKNCYLLFQVMLKDCYLLFQVMLKDCYLLFQVILRNCYLLFQVMLKNCFLLFQVILKNVGDESPSLELYPISVRLYRHHIPSTRTPPTTTFTGMMAGIGGMAWSKHCLSSILSGGGGVSPGHAEWGGLLILNAMSCATGCSLDIDHPVM